MEGLLRELVPQVIAIVVGRFTRFGVIEEAVQEALLTAAAEWPTAGVQGRPQVLAGDGRQPAIDRRVAPRTEERGPGHLCRGDRA